MPSRAANPGRKDIMKNKEIMDKLENGLRDLLDSVNWENYLKTMSRFHQYSFNNIILIMMQCPEATQVAGYNNWKKMKRFVKKGEKGIQILAPMTHKKIVDKGDYEEEVTWTSFRPVYVFDVSQTDGEALPEVCRELTDEVANFEELFEKLKGVAKVPVTIEKINANGYYSPMEDRIVIKEGMPEAQTLKTLVHEIAHSRMHKNTDKSREQKEVEAESVAYVVCQELGIESGDYTFGYIAGWADGDMKLFKKSLNEIQKTAHALISEVA